MSGVPLSAATLCWVVSPHLKKRRGLLLAVAGRSRLHDLAGCTIVDISFNPPFLMADSVRVNEALRSLALPR